MIMIICGYLVSGVLSWLCIAWSLINAPTDVELWAEEIDQLASTRTVSGAYFIQIDYEIYTNVLHYLVSSVRIGTIR